MIDTGPGPLSHSSATTLLGCEQKYVYYKVDKVPNDPDYVKGDALALGSAVHKILEKSRHEKPVSITVDLEECATDPDIMLPREDFALAHAMALKLIRLHKRMGLKVLAVEQEIQTPEFIGYIDAVMADPMGKWWIVDVKTWKSLPALEPLYRDPQLTLYASYVSLLAESLKLNLADFAGVRWRVATKSTAQQKSGEEYGAFIQRLVDKHIRAYDIAIPFEHLDTESRLTDHRRLHDRAMKLASGEATALKNFGHCMNYFTPCAYFSRCHGKNFSDTRSPTVEVEDVIR